MMKPFLLKTAFFVVLIIVSFYFVVLQADGYTDAFYMRFTTPRQSSMIIGTSRAAQAIQPQILNEKLKRSDIFNYAFTLAQSPYGPVYLNSIKEKLDPDKKDGVFILAVDPWSISSTSEDPNDTTSFKEAELALGTGWSVNMNPNIPYLLKSYDKPFYNILFNKSKEMFLHNDGWLEINISMDSNLVRKRTHTWMTRYKEETLPKYKFSEVRENYLQKTIALLQQHGQVYLVRIPVHPIMMNLEKQLLPDFNERINKISHDHNVQYLDLTYLNSKLHFTDGNHLYKGSGAEVSKVIGDWLLKLNATASK